MTCKIIWLVFFYFLSRINLSSFLTSSSLLFVLVEMPLVLSAIACGLFMHHSLGCAAIDSLAAIGIMDPKLGVTLLLTVRYCTVFSFIILLYCESYIYKSNV